MIGLQIEVEGPRSVRAMWTAPRITNGYLTYDVYYDGLFYTDPGEPVYIYVSLSLLPVPKHKLVLYLKHPKPMRFISTIFPGPKPIGA